MSRDEIFLKFVRDSIQNAENNKYLEICLPEDQEKMLERLDPELYRKYLEVRERNTKEREKFKQEIVKIALQIQNRLQKYGAEIVVDFYMHGYPQYYHLFVRLPKGRQLSDDLFREFIRELEEIGFIYVPGADNWGYMGEIGEYPPFKL